MSNIEPVIILNKLAYMENYLSQLERFKTVSLEDFLNDYDKQLIVERLLQLTIQVALDINRYLFKGLNLEQPVQNDETFIRLVESEILTSELAQSLAESAKMRNLLVHVYDEIDPIQVHRAIKYALRDYPLYQRQIVNYLDSIEVNNG